LLSISQVIAGMHITLVHLPVLVQCLMVQQVRNFFLSVLFGYPPMPAFENFI
jgi:hypothetical protein